MVKGRGTGCDAEGGDGLKVLQTGARLLKGYHVVAEFDEGTTRVPCRRAGTRSDVRRSPIKIRLCWAIEKSPTISSIVCAYS